MDHFGQRFSRFAFVHERAHPVGGLERQFVSYLKFARARKMIHKTNGCDADARFRRWILIETTLTETALIYPKAGISYDLQS